MITIALTGIAEVTQHLQRLVPAPLATARRGIEN